MSRIGKNKIIFLGTGGGGVMMSLQKCSTAGFWVNMEGVNLYFDPGPSAIYKIREAGLVPDDLKGIFISHKHLDHCSDLNALIEAVHYHVTRGGWDYRDYQVFCPADVLEYIISDHQKMPKKINKVQSEKVYQLEHLKINSSKMLLEKPCYAGKFKQFGYKISGENINFSYIPETFYQPGLYNNIKSDILVLNAMAPTKNYPEQLVKTIIDVSPKLVILQHWISRAYDYGIKKYAMDLQKATGVKIIAVKDGDVFDLQSREISQKARG